MIYAATGHRPDKLGGYDEKTWAKLCGFAALTLDRLEPDKLIIGMAQGWDLAIACGCVAIGIPFIAAAPFRGQEKVWPADKQKMYRLLCLQAEEFHVVNGGGYAPWKFLRRNEWMVNRCDEVLALWDKGPGGGTFKTVEYAQKKGVKINNVWDEWRLHCAQ